MSYPQILTSLSSNPVTTKEVWEKHRRKEILSLFETYVYGKTPIDRPDDLAFSVKEIEREQNVLQKKVAITFSGHEMEADVFVPQGNTKKLPAFLIILHESMWEECNVDHTLDSVPAPITRILERGYAVVAMPSEKVSPDVFRPRENKFKVGIFPVYDRIRRTDAWGIISAWAWGASRIMDYLETDKDIDAGRVIVVGHSRCGKTALWTAAEDTRFAMAISNNSGCSGAAFTRGKEGENVRDINRFDWFCDNYKNYMDDEDMLPIDQHMLLALIAPRPLYVCSSTEDEWAGPASELYASRLAGDAYELYGKPGLIVPDTGAEENQAYQEGYIAYHIKTGPHSMTGFDWELFMDFADKRVK